MIRNVHVEQLRELVAQAERDLAGWRFLLAQAEQGERAGTVFPDPMTPMAPTGPPPLDGPLWRPSPTLAELAAQAPGREPYPTSVMPPIDGSTLPPSQEQAIGTIWSEHDQHATSPKGIREDEQWRNA